MADWKRLTHERNHIVTTVHVNIEQITYMIPQPIGSSESGTNLFFVGGGGLEVKETPTQILTAPSPPVV